MASGDDPRGIDWLASQLGDGTAGEAGSKSSADAAASGADEADADAPATPAPALFGRGARRAAEAQAEPVTAVEPVDPPAAPTGPAQWWTAPRPEQGSPVDSQVETTDTAGLTAPGNHPAPVEPVSVVREAPAVTVILPASERDAVGADPAGSIHLSNTTADVDQPTELLPTRGAFDFARPSAGGAAAATTVIAGTATAIEAPTAAESPNRHRSGRNNDGTRQAGLVWTAVGLLAAIVLVGLFYLGQRLAGSPVPVAAPTESASPTPTLTPTPTPTPEITAMQPAGVHEWTTLFGGECVEPYVSPWEEDFTVVDCAASHTAQLVFRGNFGGDQATVFPGEAALAAQINLLCTSPGILDLSAAGAYPNLQMQGSYPLTEEQWTDEPRNFYCFASRASAEPLTTSIMGAGPKA